jgi:hypothetical protein
MWSKSQDQKHHETTTKQITFRTTIYVQKMMFHVKNCTSVYFPILTDPSILLLSGDTKFGTHSGDCKEEMEISCVFDGTD